MTTRNVRCPSCKRVLAVLHGTSVICECKHRFPIQGNEVTYHGTRTGRITTSNKPIYKDKDEYYLAKIRKLREEAQQALEAEDAAEGRAIVANNKLTIAIESIETALNILYKYEDKDFHPENPVLCLEEGLVKIKGESNA